MPWGLTLGEFFVAVLVGIVSLGAAVVAGASFIGKALTPHNWKTCQCDDCRRRRFAAHTARGHVPGGVNEDGDIIWISRNRNPHPEDNGYPRQRPTRGSIRHESNDRKLISTDSLMIDDKVRVGDYVYLVTMVDLREGWYMVSLVNLANKRHGVMKVSYDDGRRPKWEKVN